MLGKYAKNAKSRKWTEIEIKKLIEYRNNGIRKKKIGELLNRTENAIANKLNDLGIRITSIWVPKEIKLLEHKYEESTTEELVKLFPSHTLGSINKKAKAFGLVRKNKLCAKWSNKEIEKLKSLVKDKYTDKEISKELDRPITYVKCIRRQHCYEYFTWSKEEVEILKEKYEAVLIKDLLSLLLYKTKDQIQKKAASLNLRKPSSLLWSEEEVEILKREYPHKIIEELRNIFPDKGKKQINKKAKRLKLKKTKETLVRCFHTEIGKIPQLPGKNTKWRRDVLKIDGFCCQDCNLVDKTGADLRAHHIKPVRDCNEEEKYDIDNGICLCIKCHNAIHFKEYEVINKYKQKIVRRRL